MKRNIVFCRIIFLVYGALILMPFSSKGEVEDQLEPGHYLEFKSIMANLSHGEARVYLTLTIGLSLKDRSDSDSLRAEEAGIRHAIMKAAQKQGYGSLQKSDGRLLFRKRVEDIFMTRLPDRHLLQLFFLTFIVD
ncbi:MAG: flagellar basal body-associated FliL family protein [Calditrichia bacterium]